MGVKTDFTLAKIYFTISKTDFTMAKRNFTVPSKTLLFCVTLHITKYHFHQQDTTIQLYSTLLMIPKNLPPWSTGQHWESILEQTGPKC